MSSNDKNNPNQAGQTPFWLDFKFDDSDTDGMRAALDTDTPKSKGEVYFSNPPRNSYTPQPIAKPVQQKKKKRKGLGASGPIAILLLVVFVATGILSYIGIATMRDIFALGKDAEKSTVVSMSIAANQSTDQLIDQLSKQGLIKQKLLCKIYMRFSFMIKTKHEDNPKQPDYIAGEYELDTSMGLEDMLGTFIPKEKTGETVNLLFPEGYTVKQILAKIGDNRVTKTNLLNRSMLATSFEYAFLQGLNTDGRYYKYEGYLFPDTYEFYLDENPNSVLRRFFDNFQGKWKEEYTTRAVELGYTIDQIVTLASIIQKEAADASQMKNISGVLHNRLNHPSVYPMLECDSTRDYVLNNIATEMDAGASELYNDTENTYKCKGLPIGPICNPGISAIEAALNPAKNDYFYFQHDKNGKIYLNKTKPEHDKTKYQLIIDDLAQR